MGLGRWSRGHFAVLASVLSAITLGLPAAPGLREAPIGAASAPKLTISIGSASVVATAKGPTTIAFPVTLSRPATALVTVAYTTHDGTAKAGRDYNAASGRVSFVVDRRTGATPIMAFASVSIIPSARPGGAGGFSMSLSNPHGATIANSVGVGKIVGRAAGAPVRVSVGDMRMYDGASGGGTRLALVHVTLSRPVPTPIIVHYEIKGVSAKEGTHFDGPTKGAVKIPAHALGSWVLVNVVSGKVKGPPRMLRVTLTQVTRGVISRSTANVTLVAEPGSGGTTGPPPPPPPPPPTGPPPPSGLIFDDEFNGTGLDLSKWQPNWLGNNNSTITKPINGAEASCYDPAQVSQPGDGYLHLTGAKRSCRSNDGNSFQYASGLVETLPHFTFTYGYMEARMWLPGGNSATNWPAFWADGTGTWPSTGELDVMEGLHGSDCFHFHSPSGGPGGCANLSSDGGWHTFGARWEKGKVTFIYDGNNVGTVTSGITGAPMYLILNMAIGGEGGAIDVPSTMLVDWVRVSK